MRVLLLGHEEVSALLPMGECIRLMSEALVSLAEGRVHQPLRTIVRPHGAKGVLGLMPAYASSDRPAFGLKAISVFPENPARGLDSHQGAVLLFSGETGEPLAFVNASALTAVRTAAVSGAATRALAREGAGDLCVVGAGVQARAHVEAMAHARTIRRCRVASRRPEHARRLAEELKGAYAFPVEAAETVEEAVRGADIVVTATNSAEPVVRREWVSDGAHVNAVGACQPHARELDAATVAASSLFVDSVESLVNESGDYLLAAREGAVGPEHVRAELGEVLAGKRPGRTSDGEITLFKSLGLAIEDLAAAAYLYDRCRETGAGTWVSF
ncbi:MAG TPA: ornithine cyclodeaminase family protein [Pyrinomonadaceae bacterium]|nr:ornithine cyclodeaminase family protein [Pyrinomonadaceae bacterium]